MGAVLGIDTGVSLPSIVSDTFGTTLTWILIIAVLMCAAGVGIYIYVISKNFNRKIIVFENIAGQGYQIVYKDAARVVKIGDGGEEILYLRKKKVYRTAYGKKMGKNTYWFAIGQDGYWYNILLGDLDAKMGMLDIEPVDRDMRYMHVAIRKNITERYRKIGFMEKYGTFVIGGLFFIGIIVGGWMLIDQIGELLGQAAATQEIGTKTIEAINQALANVDAICSGGSGLTPA